MSEPLNVFHIDTTLMFGMVKQLVESSMTTNQGEQPSCPRCKGTNGGLGTSNAYFVCHETDCVAAFHGGVIYYLGDGRAPHEQLPGIPYAEAWKQAVLASPWGREGSGAAYFEEADNQGEQLETTCLCRAEARRSLGGGHGRLQALLWRDGCPLHSDEAIDILTQRIAEAERLLRERSRVYHQMHVAEQKPLHYGQWETCPALYCLSDRAFLTPEEG